MARAGPDRFYVPTDTSGTLDGCRIGLGWLDARAEAGVGEPLVVIQAGATSRNRYIDRALERYRSETSTTYRGVGARSWPGGPALLVYPDATMLHWFDRNRRVGALCVVQGLRYDPRSWAIAFRVEDLTSGRPYADGPSLPPTVADELRAIQARTDWRGMRGPDAIARVDRTLAKLHARGEALDPVELEAWALAEGWRPIEARRLGSHADTIVAGDVAVPPGAGGATSAAGEGPAVGHP